MNNINNYISTSIGDCMTYALKSLNQKRSLSLSLSLSLCAALHMPPPSGVSKAGKPTRDATDKTYILYILFHSLVSSASDCWANLGRLDINNDEDDQKRNG